MNCAGGTASGLSFTLALMTGPVGMVAFTAAGVDIAYATHRANEYLDEARRKNNGS